MSRKQTTIVCAMLLKVLLFLAHHIFQHMNIIKCLRPCIIRPLCNLGHVLIMFDGSPKVPRRCVYELHTYEVNWQV